MTRMVELVTTRRDAVLVALFVDNRHLSRMNCHQRSERSFHIRNRQFYICARCTGLVAGVAIGPLLPIFGHRLTDPLGFVLLVFLFDGITQLAKWRTSNNLLRFGTGAALSSCMVGAAIQYVCAA